MYEAIHKEPECDKLLSEIGRLLDKEPIFGTFQIVE